MAIKIRPFIFYFAVVCCIALLGFGVYCLISTGCYLICLALVCCIALAIVLLAIGTSDLSSDIQQELQPLIHKSRDTFKESLRSLWRRITGKGNGAAANGEDLTASSGNENNLEGAENPSRDSKPRVYGVDPPPPFKKPTPAELQAFAEGKKRNRGGEKPRSQDSNHSILIGHERDLEADEEYRKNKGKTLDLSQQPPARQEQPKKWSGRTKTSALEDPLIALYNRAAENPSERQTFKERYNPIRFGTQNAMQRREDFSIDAVFQTANDGDYYAVKLHDSAPNLYAVVPRFDLLFQESSYGPGAMGDVFECRNYNPQLRYRRVKVIQAAIFESRDRQSWELKETGILELGQSD